MIGRSTKLGLDRISFAVSGELEMMNRVSPTEKDIREREPAMVAERAANILCGTDEVKTRARPRKGSPVGPGMARVGVEDWERWRARDQARPPGCRRSRRKGMRRRVRERERGELGMRRVRSVGDIGGCCGEIKW